MSENNEIPFELALHNLRSNAEEISGIVSKAKRRAWLGYLVSLIVLVIATIAPIRYFFFLEKPVFCVLIFLADIILAFVAFFVVGNLCVGKKNNFLKLYSKSIRFLHAIEEMDIMEEKQLDKKAFDKDIEKAEDKLISASENLVGEYKF